MQFAWTGRACIEHEKFEGSQKCSEHYTQQCHTNRSNGPASTANADDGHSRIEWVSKRLTQIHRCHVVRISFWQHRMCRCGPWNALTRWASNLSVSVEHTELVCVTNRIKTQSVRKVVSNLNGSWPRTSIVAHHLRHCRDLVHKLDASSVAAIPYIVSTVDKQFGSIVSSAYNYNASAIISRELPPVNTRTYCFDSIFSA